MNDINTARTVAAANAIARNLHHPWLMKALYDTVLTYPSSARLAVAIFNVSWRISSNQAADMTAKAPITTSI